MQKSDLKIVQVGIDELKDAEYNPRKWSKKAFEELKEDIIKFGFIDPLVVNSAKNRKNIIIGGHFRKRVAVALDYEKLPVIFVNIPDIEKEKELNLRLNRTHGEFDYEMLKEYDKDLLKSVGFDEKELEQIYKQLEPKEDTEIDFTEELMEEHNYLVLYFDNEIDWLNLLSRIGLQKVQSLDSKPGFRKAGVGRVIKGSVFLNKLDEN